MVKQNFSGEVKTFILLTDQLRYLQVLFSKN